MLLLIQVNRGVNPDPLAYLASKSSLSMGLIVTPMSFLNFGEAVAQP